MHKTSVIKKKDLNRLITQYYEEIRQKIAKDAPETTRLDVPIKLKDFDRLNEVQIHVKNKVESIKKSNLSEGDEYEENKQFLDYLECFGSSIGCRGFIIQIPDLSSSAKKIYLDLNTLHREEYDLSAMPFWEKSEDEQKLRDDKLIYLKKRIEALNIQLALEAINKNVVYSVLEKKIKKKELNYPEKRLMRLLNMTYQTDNEIGEYLPISDETNIGYILSSEDEEVIDHELTHAYVGYRLNKAQKNALEKYEIQKKMLGKKIQETESKLREKYSDYAKPVIELEKEDESKKAEIDKQLSSDLINVDEHLQMWVVLNKDFKQKENDIAKAFLENSDFARIYGEIKELIDMRDKAFHSKINYEDPYIIYYQDNNIDAINEGGAHAISRLHKAKHVPGYDFYEKKHNIKKEHLEKSFMMFSEISKYISKDQLRHLIADIACEVYTACINDFGTDYKSMNALDLLGAITDTIREEYKSGKKTSEIMGREYQYI